MQNAGLIESLCVGIVGSLVFGVGMCIGLDAIHDTVHEMARDEAHHGMAFEGAYKRFFG